MIKKQIVGRSGRHPNSGKTTVFNNLTGARQRVGNWRA
jgi:Fe2+ transport system protein B